MLWIEMFELKASVVPERLKVWRDMEACGDPNLCKIVEKFHLTSVSVSVTH